MVKQAASKAEAQFFEPPWPILTATGLLMLWVALLSIPMWRGDLIGTPGV